MKERIETDNGLAKAVMEPFADSDDFMKNVDATVVNAKSEIAKWHDFNKLFDSQIVTLVERGVPEQIVRWFQDGKENVVGQAMKMAFGNGNIPFLPVIPLEERTFYDLMNMVRGTNGRTGHVGRTFSVVDVVHPSYHRYMFDVNEGTIPIEGSEKKAEKILAQQNRFSLNAVEVIALCVHTDVLSRLDYIPALGSRLSGDKDIRPAISTEKNFSKRPTLCWGYVQGHPRSIGVPSRDCWPRVKPLIEEPSGA